MFLNLPATAVEPLSSTLDRPAQLLAAAVTGTAAGYMHDRPYARFDNCLYANLCPPRRADGPLCLICAVDHAVERHAAPRPDADLAEMFAIGVLVKGSAMYIITANPDAPADKADREALATLSTRLHTGDFRPMTATEQEEIVMRLRCLRAVDGAGYRGRLRVVDAAVLTDLEARGWAVGGYTTPAGRHAADAARRANARARS